MIRLATLVLLSLALWRLLVRRHGDAEVVTIGWRDGTARSLEGPDPLRDRILAIVDRVAP